MSKTYYFVEKQQEMIRVPIRTPQKSLRRFNLFMAGLHCLQAMAMAYFSTDFNLPIYTTYVDFIPETQKLLPSLSQYFSLQIGPLVALFLFASSLAHFLISLPKINRWYEKNLSLGMNPARWIEYSFSSSLMLIVIAMLAGMSEFISLIFLFFLNMMMILFGWVMELHNQTTEKTNWTSFIFGCLAGIIPWVGIALHLFNAGGDTGRAPDFVYWIFFSIFIFFNSFALNMILQYKKIGPWKNYLFGERMYIVLSLVAKSLLAWQVWAGTLRPV